MWKFVGLSNNSICFKVTGSNKGIGFAIVKGLCKKFDGVVYLTARDVGRGKSAIEKLKKLGLSSSFHQLDITSNSSIKTFAGYIKEKYGGLDVLVNNAAIAYPANSSVPFERQAEDTISVNYTALVNVCHALFPLLRPNARVVNLSSSAGHLLKIPSKELREQLTDPSLSEGKITALMKEFVESAKRGDHVTKWGQSSYSVSKVAVSALTVVQQREFDKDSTKDILVNSVHPGFVNTDLTNHQGVLSIEEGAYAPLQLALLPPDATVPRGEYVWKDFSIVSWVEPLSEAY